MLWNQNIKEPTASSPPKETLTDLNNDWHARKTAAMKPYAATLIALSNPASRKAFKESIAGLGVDATFCRSAVEAIAVFKKGKYQHAILDHDLFPIGGLELAKIMQSVNPELKVTIIMPHRPVEIEVNKFTFTIATWDTPLSELVHESTMMQVTHGA